MKYYLILIVILFCGARQLFAQQVLFQHRIDRNGIAQLLNNEIVNPPVSHWNNRNKIGIDLSEVAFVNWNAGGSNSISGLAELNLARNYFYRNIKWNNSLVAKYGINSQQGRELRKTDDQLDIRSEFGYRRDTISNWFYSAKFSFQTQLSNGYKYPDKDNPISQFMAPAYVFLGVGAEYGKRMENLSVYASPLTYKSTFVLNQDLANNGAFGVKKAVRDADGNILQPGKNVRSELGILVSSVYRGKVMENINFYNTVRFYTDYLNSFGNVDVDWEFNFNFKVNSYVVAKLGSHLKYDNDVKFTETNADGEEVAVGPKTQWKQQLGIGVVVDF